MQENYGSTRNGRPATVTQDSETEGPDNSAQRYLYSVASVAVIGSMLFGYNTGIMSGLMPLVEDEFALSFMWKETIIACGIGSAALFALFAGFACDKFGRKSVIMSSSLIFILGAGVSGASVKKEMLLVGRVIVGMGMGFASMAIPVYLAELSPPSVRGRIVTLSPLCMTLGIFISGVSAGGFSAVGHDGWRYMHFLQMIPAFIQLIGFFFLPESPRWMVSKRNILRARRVLQQINGTSNVEIELGDIDHSVQQANTSPGTVITKVLGTQHVRKALLIGVFLNVVTSLSGINSVIYNSGQILQMGGFSPQSTLWLVCVPNIINFLAELIAVILVERIGRKKLLLGSLIGVILAATILATGYLLSIEYSPEIDRSINETTHSGNLLSDGCYDAAFSNCESCVTRADCGFCYKGTGQSGSCLRADLNDQDSASMYGRCSKSAISTSGTKWSHYYCPTKYNFIIVLGMAWFLPCFAAGLGPMTWTITSEIFPLWARSTCFAIGAGVNWACYLLVAIFISVFDGIDYGAFWISVGVCVIGAFITFKFVPETGQMALEETEQLFGAEMNQPRNLVDGEIAKKDVFVVGGQVIF